MPPDDMLTEAIRKGEIEANQGQPGMRTPKQAEAEARQQEAEALAAGRVDLHPEQQQNASTITTESVLAKLEKGEDLSAEEQAVYDKAEAALKAAPAKSYKINGVDYTSDQMAKVAKDGMHISDTTWNAMTAEEKQSIVDFKYESESKAAGEISLSKRQQQAAEDRKTIQRGYNLLNIERSKLARDRAVLEHALGEYKLKAKFAEEVQQNRDLLKGESGDLDPRKQNEYEDSRDAAREAARIQREIEMNKQHDEFYKGQGIEAQVFDFLDTHPQFKTKEPVSIVTQKMQKGEAVDPEDRQKAIELQRILEESLGRGGTMEDIFANDKRANRTPFPDMPAQSAASEVKPPILPSKKATMAAMLREHQEKVKAGIIPPVNAGAPDRLEQSNKLTAEKLIRVSQAAGGAGDDKFLQEMGYKPR